MNAFEEDLRRFVTSPEEGVYGCQVPKGVWHTVEVIEPSVIYEGKDKKYGEDGSGQRGQVGVSRWLKGTSRSA